MDGESDASRERLEQVQRRVTQWRRSRKRRGGRMPNELWVLAAEAAASCGVEATASGLGLDAARVQDWMNRLGLEEGRAEQPKFVELPPFPAGAPSECTVELEDLSGRKLRISLKGQAIAHVLELGPMLWRSQA
jgi:hypothetical protein